MFTLIRRCTPVTRSTHLIDDEELFGIRDCHELGTGRHGERVVKDVSEELFLDDDSVTSGGAGGSGVEDELEGWRGGRVVENKVTRHVVVQSTDTANLLYSTTIHESRDRPILFIPDHILLKPRQVEHSLSSGPHQLDPSLSHRLMFLDVSSSPSKGDAFFQTRSKGQALERETLTSGGGVASELPDGGEDFDELFFVVVELVEEELEGFLGEWGVGLGTGTKGSGRGFE